MKVGKVSQTVLKRSLLKPLQFHRKEVYLEPSVEEMCYGIDVEPDERCIAANTVLYGDEKDLGVFALAQVINDLASRGAEPVGVSVQLVLPPHAYESRLKAMALHIEEAASTHEVQVVSIKAETSPALQTTMLYMTGLGIVKKGELIQSKMAKPEQDIVLLKWVGLEGTLRVLNQKEKELSERFVASFLNQLRLLRTQLFSVEALRLARSFDVSAMHQVANGGILAALWELTESAGVGMEIMFKQMPIRQETVEICEHFHLNPYQLTSIGSVLIVTSQGEELAAAMTERGIPAQVIGRTTTDTAKMILGGEEKRYLDRPAPDELLQLYEKE